ncbi:MAG: hypothetical protein OXE96_15530 [Gemmatimonadetes bacterium]|nr:hypothetical protein [Gemmatimonadota bacterium]
MNTKIEAGAHGPGRGAVVAVALGLFACETPADDPSLVVRRDSAGVEIVEALRPAWGDSDGWRIDPEPIVDLAMSGSGPTHEFARVLGMARLSDGSIALADGVMNELRLYAPDGGFVGSAGRAGEGPGEFSGGMYEMVMAAGDTMWVRDWGRRVSMFAPDLTPVRTFGLTSPISGIHDLEDGTMIVGFHLPFGEGSDVDGLIQTPTALWRFDLEGNRLDSIGGTDGYTDYVRESSRGGVMSIATLFPVKAQVATHGGMLFVGNADVMDVEERTAAGDLARILRVRDYDLGLSAAELRAERDDFLGDNPSALLQEVAERTPASGKRPAYADMIVDPAGAIWLQRFRGDSEMDNPDRWLVLNADGVWLGSVEVPERFQILDIETDAVLGVWRDELNVPHPQALPLHRN